MSESHNSAPPIDKEYLYTITDNDEEFVEELVCSYVDSSVKMMAELRNAVDHADAHRVRHAAHALKGSSRAIGAVPAGAAFEVLENLGRDEDLTEALTVLQTVEEQYGLLVEYLQSVWPVSAGVS